ncbi:ABC transporter substrate-binding protein [Rhodococcus rhodochrous]|uniref:ABC transporter substrate-binding protein n=1 Tax=Rhodococcus rhodochrous TaxID=1829 RepID=A0AAW4XDY4_RHORH|nr:ABC transporter substrate-binding protein [Rhodococcus rhodochrous]MCD2111313.1 ABC transporter substrate-binding protein [Rhodococcus rhodochrous]
MHIRPHLLSGTAALSVCAAVLTGCSSNSDAAVVEATENGLVPLRVTTLGLCNEALPWGVEEGVFAEHGIDLELINVQSGAAGISALQAGEVDIAFVNSYSAMQAVAQGIDLVVASGGDQSTDDANAVVVSSGAGVTEPKQLQGKKVGVNQIGGLGHILTQAWIEADAGEASTTEFVALPFPDLLPGVVAGAVDGAQVTAAQAVAGESDGTTVSLGNPFFDGIGSIPTTVYASTGGFAEVNADTLASFADAMTELADLANDPANDEQRWAYTAEFCKSTPETLAQTPEPEFVGRVGIASFESLVSLLVARDSLTDIDLDSFVPEGVRQ